MSDHVNRHSTDWAC